VTAVLSLRKLAVVLDGQPVLGDVSLDVQAGTVVGLIGPNGAGKTTLLDAVTGHARSRGQVLLSGEPVAGLAPHALARRGLARTFQSLELFEDLDVRENLRVAAESSGRVAHVDTAIDGLVDRLRLAPVARRLPRLLTHGERARVALGRALAGRPDVLLLDESAAGLDAAQRGELAELVRGLAQGGAAVVLVDHDTDLVLQTCDVVHVLQSGQLLASGTPQQVSHDPRVVAAYLGSGEHPGRVARHEERSTTALVARGLRAGYGDVEVLRDVSLQVAAGEVVAVLGRNGAGKSTLLRVVAGLHRPTAGRLDVLGGSPRSAREAARRGVTLVPQGRGLFLRLTGAENLRLARARVPVEDVLPRFPELGPLLHRPVAELSGGQQQQLALARALVAGPRLLLVDELSLGLAPKVVEDLLVLVREVADRSGTAVLLVEQHAPLALSVADRALVLDRGRVALEGTAAELAADPERLRAGYLGAAPP
jgi:branched-chain amino acid transport system ATP-binding protein